MSLDRIELSAWERMTFNANPLVSQCRDNSRKANIAINERKQGLERMASNQAVG